MAGATPLGAYPPPGAPAPDDAIAGVARQGDDIDQLIRMAEAGIKPPRIVADPTEAPAEKNKKDKSTRMIYADGEFSLEEKIARTARYAITT